VKKCARKHISKTAVFSSFNAAIARGVAANKNILQEEIVKWQ
jgi:hypothetical protein